MTLERSSVSARVKQIADGLTAFNEATMSGVPLVDRLFDLVAAQQDIASVVSDIARTADIARRPDQSEAFRVVLLEKLGRGSLLDDFRNICEFTVSDRALEFTRSYGIYPDCPGPSVYSSNWSKLVRLGLLEVCGAKYPENHNGKPLTLYRLSELGEKAAEVIGD